MKLNDVLEALVDAGDNPFTGPARVPTEDLVHHYWTMPVDSDEDAAALDAIQAELVRRQVTLRDTLAVWTAEK